MTTQLDVIKKFMAALDETDSQGEAALDEAISAVSNFSTYADFRTQLLSDCKTVNNAETFLRNYCGITLDDSDTGAITGTSSGGSVKTAESIVPESGELINFTGDTFTVNGLTVKLGNGNSSGTITSARSFSDLNANEVYLWQALYTWWMAGGLDLIAESYGDNYGFDESGSAVTKTLWVVMSNLGSGTLAVTWGGPGYAQKSTNDLRIYINTYYYGSVTGEDGVPNNGQKYLDRTLAHELTHAVMRANIDYFDYLPGFIKEGVAEITHGIDDTRTSALKTLAGSSSKLGQALSLNINTVTVSGVASASYAGGYIFLRYLAHQNADLTLTNTTASTSLKTFAGNDTIKNSASRVTIDAGDGDDSIVGGGTNNFYVWTGGDDTIRNFGATDTLSIAGGFSQTISGNDVLLTADGGSVLLTGAAKLSTLNVNGNSIVDTTPADTTLTVTNATSSPVTINSAIEVVDASTRTKAVKITGNALDNTLTGGSGNDTLNGNSGDDLLTGGGGADVFIYGAGSDTVTDYGTGDKLSLTSAIESFGSVGNDFVFDFDNGSLTLSDAASKKISVVGNSNVFAANGIYNSAGTAVTVNTSTKEFTADSKLVTIDAASTSSATITGNSKANKVSLGNENVFIWTGGNDTLSNFAANDLLSVTGAVSDVSTSGGNSIVKVGTNKITVKDSSQVIFSDSGGTRIFDGGVFFDADETSATLATSTKNFDASDTNVTSIVGNAKANKLTSNATGATLTGGRGNDTFVTAGGDDFITDYGTGSDKVSLNSSIENFTVTGDDVSLDLSDGSLTIAGGAGKKISLVSGGKTTANIFTDDGLFNAAGTAVTLSASTETFTATSKLVTIDAGLTSNATITGNSKANKVSLANENVYVWTGGNDTLDNFDDDDLISITGAVTDGSIRSGNSYVKVGANKITVKDSAQVTFTDTNGTRIFDGGIFFDADETSATLGSSIKDFDATDNVISITGNAKANKLHAGDNSTTLTGGKGNDSLWGGTSSDTFTYSKGDGKDVIFNFGANDLLEIVGLDGTVAGKFNSAGDALTVKVGGTAVAVLKDFGATTTFNVTADGTACKITK